MEQENKSKDLKYSWYPEGSISDEEKQYRLEHDMPILERQGKYIAGVCVENAKDDYDTPTGLLRRIRSIEYKQRNSFWG